MAIRLDDWAWQFASKIRFHEAETSTHFHLVVLEHARKTLHDVQYMP